MTREVLTGSQCPVVTGTCVTIIMQDEGPMITCSLPHVLYVLTIINSLHRWWLISVVPCRVDVTLPVIRRVRPHPGQAAIRLAEEDSREGTRVGVAEPSGHAWALHTNLSLWLFSAVWAEKTQPAIIDVFVFFIPSLYSQAELDLMENEKCIRRVSRGSLSYYTPKDTTIL